PILPRGRRKLGMSPFLLLSFYRSGCPLSFSFLPSLPLSLFPPDALPGAWNSVESPSRRAARREPRPPADRPSNDPFLAGHLLHRDPRSIQLHRRIDRVRRTGRSDGPHPRDPISIFFSSRTTS